MEIDKRSHIGSIMQMIPILKSFQGSSANIYKDTIYILFLTVWSICFNGYRFGVGDQFVYIPYLKATIDRSLYPNDLLLAQMHYYTSYFYSIFAQFTTFENIEKVFFCFYFMSLFLSFLILYKLSLFMFESREIAYLSILFFMIPKLLIGAMFTYQISFVVRDLVMPALMFSIYMFFKGKNYIAFSLAALTANIHPTESFFVISILLFCIVFENRTKKAEIFKYLMLIILVSSPILVWIYNIEINSFSNIDMLTWVELLRMRSIFLFPFSDLRYLVIFLIIVPIFYLSLKQGKNQLINKKVLYYFYATMILCVFGTIFTEIIPIGPVFSVQLLRSFKYLYIIFLPYIGNYLLILLNDNSVYKKIAGIGLFALMFFGFYLIYMTFINLIADGREWMIGMIIVIIIISICVYVFYFKNKIGNIFSKKMSIILLLIILLMLPSTSSLYYNYGHEKGTELENDWITLQLWCKGNTPKDSLFLIPPYVQDFRIWSERSVFPTWDDGTMGTYNYSFSKEWWYRMQELGYTRHNYKTYSNNNYNNISELALTNLSKKYGINYLITDRTRRLNYTLVHESKFSRIYKFSD